MRFMSRLEAQNDCDVFGIVYRHNSITVYAGRLYRPSHHNGRGVIGARFACTILREIQVGCYVQGVTRFIDGTGLMVAVGRDETVVPSSKWSQFPVSWTVSPICSVDSNRPVPPRNICPAPLYRPVPSRKTKLTVPSRRQNLPLPSRPAVKTCPYRPVPP